MVGNNWCSCDPANPKNRRRRPAILVEQGATTVLVDTPTDLRNQLLDAHVERLKESIRRLEPQDRDTVPPNIGRFQDSFLLRIE